MKKEKSTPLSKDVDAVRELESLRYVFRDPQSALESNENTAYEWLEDSVIRKMASVHFGKDETGKDTATIKMIDPKTKNNETVYYTTDENQIASLKRILENKPLVIEVQEKILKIKVWTNFDFIKNSLL